MNILMALARAADTTALNSVVPKPGKAGNVSELFTNMTSTIALIAGIIAFIYLIYSGILYLSAAGNPDSAKKGQQGIINAIIGIIIIVAAWAIINAVNGTAGSVAGV